jgi:hypothetical protein
MIEELINIKCYFGFKINNQLDSALREMGKANYLDSCLKKIEEKYKGDNNIIIPEYNKLLLKEYAKNLGY